MDFESKGLVGGSLQMTITLSPEEVKDLSGRADGVEPLAWGKTDYCVNCSNSVNHNDRFTIESYGDIAAAVEAAATCLARTGDPSFGMSKGKCP